MIIYTDTDMAIPTVAGNTGLEDPHNAAEETSIAHFCDFVTYYTRHSTNPLCTALTCEKQAEALRITERDLSPETIQMLIETMLTVIDHLEKKWLDEQIQRDDVIHMAQRHPGNRQGILLQQTQKQATAHNPARHSLWQQGIQRLQQWWFHRNRRRMDAHRHPRKPATQRQVIALQ